MNRLIIMALFVVTHAHCIHGSTKTDPFVEFMKNGDDSATVRAIQNSPEIINQKNINIQCAHCGCTALHMALSMIQADGSTPIPKPSIAELLQLKADISLTNNDQENILHIMAKKMYHSPDIADQFSKRSDKKKLLAQKDKRGRTPLGIISAHHTTYHLSQDASIPKLKELLSEEKKKTE